MSIRPMDLSTITVRTQDISQIKSNEDARPFAEQLTIETQRDNEDRRFATRVNQQADSDHTKGKYDARDKGSNEYQDNRRNRPKQEAKKADASVKAMSSGGFDIRI